MLGLAKPVWKVSGYVLLVLIVLAPLTFGAVMPWAWATCAVLAGVILLAAAVPTILDYGAPLPQWRELRVPAALCAIALLWVLFQLSPWPVDWQYPIWSVASDVLGRPVHGAISLNPGAGLEIITRWLMYGAVFMTAYVWGHDAKRSMRALNIIVIAATVYAFYSLIVLLGGSDVVLWIHKTTYQLDATGPFINKNNFASYLGAVLVIAIGLLLRRIMHDAAGAGAHEFWRRLIALLTGRALYLTVAVIVLFTALLLTHSRAGLGSFAVGFVALLLLLRFAGLLRGKMFFWGAGIMAAVLIGLFFMSGEGVFSRLVSEDEPARPQLYALVVNAIADRPWLGSGLGSFPQIFQIYRTEDMPPEFFTERAHSVYLETILELGIPAALALFAGLGWLIARVGISVTADARHRTIPAAAMAAMTVLLVHSLIDFPLQIPALTMLFAYLLGLGAAQAKN